MAATPMIAVGLSVLTPQQAERVPGGEVLELDQNAGERFLRRRNEFVEKCVVIRSRDAASLQTQIQRVGEKCRVVRAHIE